MVLNFPYQVAEVMEFEKSEEFEWVLVNKRLMKLKRMK